ncbi:patatin-like phospholipase family protein [Aureimonas populi]|uniref:Patatin-like phospholipase family protein n=1 Tax=Aureimonas populi TaxID=1701758 RepID=A0ABW5CJQ6_9HYPH|nr:patatin-like phospholipase family protein [Aureimonas populi]
MAKRICLALQGGGAHGAFTWGVLDRLLERQAIEVTAVSGTSAGAMNAAALVTGLVAGGPSQAREGLSRFWQAVSERSPLGVVERAMPFMPMPFMEGALERMKVFGQLVSPYHPALPTANALKSVIEATIDLGLLASQTMIPTFVSATDVESGRARLFTGRELSADALLASACLPNLFRAVEIDGRSYWDGGYTGNPVLTPLFSDDCDCTDLLIVQVTPFERAGAPRQPAEIMNRVNEITFNSSLLRDLRTVAEIQKLARGERFENSVLRRTAALRVHMIAAGPEIGEGGVAGKLDTRLSALSRLCDLGRAAALRWMEESYEAVGQRSTASPMLESFT